MHREICRCVQPFCSARHFSLSHWPWVPVRYLQTLARRLLSLARNRQKLATSQSARSVRVTTSLFGSGTRRILLRWRNHRFLVAMLEDRKSIVFYGCPRLAILSWCEFSSVMTTTASNL